MDINSLVGREEIQEELKKKAAGGGEMSDSRFWRIPDKKSLVRLLPRLESKVPWKVVYSHRYNKSGEKIFATCMATFGKKGCPICKKSWSLWESEDKAIKDLGYQVRKSPRYLINCYIVNDAEKPENNGTVKIISVGKKLFDLIVESYNSEDLGPAIFDATDGFDFEINRKQSGDNPNYPDYSSSRFIFKRYPVVKSFSEISEKLININELIKEETPEELKAKFSFLGFTDVQTPITESKAPSTLKTETKTQKKEEDDINLDDLEGDNGSSKVKTEDLSDIDIEDELSEFSK
jgi:hypothetical protein